MKLHSEKYYWCFDDFYIDGSFDVKIKEVGTDKQKVFSFTPGCNAGSIACHFDSLTDVQMKDFLKGEK